MSLESKDRTKGRVGIQVAYAVFHANYCSVLYAPSIWIEGTTASSVGCTGLYCTLYGAVLCRHVEFSPLQYCTRQYSST